MPSPHAALSTGPTSGYFGATEPVRYAGPTWLPSPECPLAYRWYEPDRLLLGKRMEDHLRFAVCYGHRPGWPGNDPFGSDTSARPSHAVGADPLQQARAKAHEAFDLFTRLGVPFFTFHDRAIAPEGATLAESNANVRKIGEVLAHQMETTGVRLLWGSADLFSHRRYMSGAATNPDPEVFAYAAAQVKNVLELTHELEGDNYRLWSGREGDDTLLNTDLKREFDQLGRFLQLVVEHKHKIGFKGKLLLEPNPGEPIAAVYGFLQRYGLERELAINLEPNHALRAGHSFAHEIVTAQALGIFGSIDINRSDNTMGGPPDPFPNNLQHIALALYHIILRGGFSHGGLNFAAKVSRQFMAPDDLLIGHAHAIDLCARALGMVERMIEDGAMAAFVAQRYASWDTGMGRAILGGKRSLEDLATWVQKHHVEPQPRSGRQGYLEMWVNSYL